MVPSVMKKTKEQVLKKKENRNIVSKENDTSNNPKISDFPTLKPNIVNLGKQSIKFEYPIVVIGNFEGIHLGHDKILKKLKLTEQTTGGQSVVLTYKYHTSEFFAKKNSKNIKPYMLLEPGEKERILLEKYKVHSILYLGFNEKIFNLSAENFIREILIKKIGAKEIICGYDTHFGKNRLGNYHLLLKMAVPLGLKIHLVNPHKIDGTIISSNKIRFLITHGYMQQVREFLGRDYSISGKVVGGKKKGRENGFPTMNISPIQKNKLYPGQGVYITLTKIDEKSYYGLTNIGVAPTLKTDNKIIIENYLCNFSGNLYDKLVRVNFLKYLRRETKFKNHQELIGQIKMDVEELKKFMLTTKIITHTKKMIPAKQYHFKPF